VPLSLEKSREFDRQFLEIYRDFAGKSVSQISLTQQMMRTVKLGVHCGVIFPGGVFPLIKCLMALDGMVIQAAPHAKLLEDVAQFASDFDLIQPAQRAAAVA
jgi:predicted unusual protein kinase regulating ubiquinone biosynthesis (AarF/ABC1/UbiB family)